MSEIPDDVFDEMAREEPEIHPRLLPKADADVWIKDLEKNADEPDVRWPEVFTRDVSGADVGDILRIGEELFEVVALRGQRVLVEPWIGGAEG